MQEATNLIDLAALEIILISSSPFLGLVLGSFAGQYFNFGYNKYKKETLKKAENYDNWLITKDSFENIHSIAELESKVNYQKVQNLVPLLNTLSEHTSIYNMKSVYQNLSNAQTIKKRALLLEGLGGTYDPETNTIELGRKKSLPHEFMHLASGAYDGENEISYDGFSQYSHKNKTSIGSGLNEGYTELLTSRWFNNGKVNSYNNVVRLAELFEFFFDDPKDMENYYFNHNLLGFIKYMEQFTSRKEIVEILTYMDILVDKLSTPIPLPDLDEIEVTMKLYRIFKSHCQDKEKLSRFEEKMKRSTFIRFTLAKKKFSLSRENPYDKKHDNQKSA